MGAEVNVAVIMIRNRSTAPPPPPADIRRWFSEGAFSVGKFWRDATYSWVSYPRFDYFGWLDLALPTVGRRDEVVDIAKDAASDAGANLDPYTHFVAVVTGAGAPDTGAAGTVLTINTTDPHSFATHEFGHILGFDHTLGIMTLGGDQDDDAIPELGPVYGDPYCIMSARTYGDARPEFDLASKYRIRRPAGMPEAWLTGPAPARATIHYQMPEAIESAYGKVAHIHEGRGSDTAVLNRAGGGLTGPELVVFHPSGDFPSSVGLGRVYVEYRMPSGMPDGTLWDQGLATSGGERDRAGIIVHVVRPTPVPEHPFGVWYAGRIVLPTEDLDVTVQTDLGPVTVAISWLDAKEDRPQSVQVSIQRAASRSVNLIIDSRDERVVTSTETRTAPTLPGSTGSFTWEKREVTRTTRYRPFVRGLGGEGPIEGGTLVKVAWSVGGVALTSTPGKVNVPVVGHPNGVLMTFAIHPGTKELTLSNLPADGSYTVPVVCTATASSDTGEATGSSVYSVAGLEEGWGEDYLRFQDWWYNVTHPIPIEILKPKWWLNERLGRIDTEVNAVEALNPDLAATMRQISSEQIRVLSRR